MSKLGQTGQSCNQKFSSFATSQTYLKLFVFETSDREILDEQVVELLRKESCRRGRVSSDRRASLVLPKELADSQLKATILLLILLAVHLIKVSEAL